MTSAGTGLPRGRDTLRETRAILRVHLGATIALVLGVMGAMLVAEWILARAQAQQTAETVAARVAASMGDTLSDLDLGDAAAAARAVDDVIAGYLDVGAVDRVKLWRVEGDRVRVVHSDEHRVVGDVRGFDPALAARLDAGEIVVQEVPDDAEHRFEAVDRERLREAFIGFADVRGVPMRMEVYVVVPGAELVASAALMHVPVVAGSVAVLIAVLVPLSLSLVRRVRRLDDERRVAMAYAVESRHEERMVLARRLHDGIVQDIAGVRMGIATILGSVGDESSRALLQRMSDVLDADARALRQILDDTVDEVVTARTLPAAIARAAERARTADIVVEVRVGDPGEMPDPLARLVLATAGELLRNAVRHAGAARVCVELTRDADAVELSVSDDGVGIAHAEAAGPGHVGLRLVRQALTAAGGELRLRTDGGTRAVARVPVADLPVARP